MVLSLLLGNVYDDDDDDDDDDDRACSNENFTRHHMKNKKISLLLN